VGTTMVHIQPDAEEAFSGVRKYMKKLDLGSPREGCERNSRAT